MGNQQYSPEFKDEAVRPLASPGPAQVDDHETSSPDGHGTHDVPQPSNHVSDTLHRVPHALDASRRSPMSTRVTFHASVAPKPWIVRISSALSADSAYASDIGPIGAVRSRTILANDSSKDLKTSLPRASLACVLSAAAPSASLTSPTAMMAFSIDALMESPEIRLRPSLSGRKRAKVGHASAEGCRVPAALEWCDAIRVPRPRESRIASRIRH